ncbi:hypothetical protein ABZ805_05075 [Saccharopolyspora sp. NPDC047091]|uniref:hypothetical protein n=1 Tax=Saccharopolyspora sp. NPDC047091 TaxID=3155924 RepID=UPI0034089EE4
MNGPFDQPHWSGGPFAFPGSALGGRGGELRQRPRARCHDVVLRRAFDTLTGLAASGDDALKLIHRTEEEMSR